MQMIMVAVTMMVTIIIMTLMMLLTPSPQSGDRFLGYWRTPTLPERAPRGAPEATKTVPRTVQSLPKRPKRSRRAQPDGFRRRQTGQRRPKTACEAPSRPHGSSQRPPRCPQEASKSATGRLNHSITTGKLQVLMNSPFRSRWAGLSGLHMPSRRPKGLPKRQERSPREPSNKFQEPAPPPTPPKRLQEAPRGRQSTRCSGGPL